MSRVELQSACLTYDVRRENQFAQWLSNRIRGAHASARREIQALRNVSLKVSEGDRLGIVGHNGAGKSSLLKLIAGIYPSTSGKVLVEGNIAALFELSTGFEMEATGWENIYLRGLMLNETPRSMRRKAGEIAEFSGLGDFLDIPVKYYSSGMFVRLAFSVSTSINADILLLDEVVAAGDAEFLDRAQRRLKDMIHQAKIMLYVTHNTASLKDFCNRCLWLDGGMVRMEGDPVQVSERYLKTVLAHS